MIYGIGTDIIKVERMKAAVERWGERFLRKVFTAGEIAYCYKKKDPYPSLSVRFAAKEAFIKAMGGVPFIPLTAVEVANKDGGRPVLELKGGLREFFREHSLREAHLSLSHERDYGIAFVVVESEEGADRPAYRSGRPA